MMDWPTIFTHAIGTVIGAVGAYIGLRVDLAMMRGSLDALRERISGVESTARSAHDRIDRIMHKER